VVFRFLKILKILKIFFSRQLGKIRKKRN